MNLSHYASCHVSIVVNQSINQFICQLVDGDAVLIGDEVPQSLIISSVKFAENCSLKSLFSVKIDFWINTCMSSWGQGYDYSRKTAKVYFCYSVKLHRRYPVTSCVPCGEGCHRGRHS